MLHQSEQSSVALVGLSLYWQRTSWGDTPVVSAWSFAANRDCSSAHKLHSIADSLSLW